MSEAKKVLLSRRLLGLLALLLALSVVLLVAGDTHSKGFYRHYQDALEQVKGCPLDEAQAEIEGELAHISELSMNGTAQQEDYIRQEALEALSNQISDLQQYPEYLNTIHANADSMANMAIFHRNDPFTLRNIAKTDADYPRAVALALDNSFAVEGFVSDRLSGYSLLVFMLAVVLLLLEERRRGLWSLVHGTPNGRARLAGKRIGILLAASVLGAIVLLGGRLLAGILLCGGLGDLSRTVQSVSCFREFPIVMTVWQFLALYFLCSVLGMWLLSLLVWALLQAVNQLQLALAAAAVFLAAEYAAFHLIPDSFALVWLRYANVFAFAELGQVLLHYLNLNLFGRPVQGYILTLGLFLPLLALACGANLLLAERKKPVTRQNSLLALLDRLRIPFSIAISRLRLFCFELYKLLFLQKGILVLLALVLFAAKAQRLPYPDTTLYDVETAGYAASLQGPYNEALLDTLDEKITAFSCWQDRETAEQQIEILSAIRENAAASISARDGKWLVDPAPYLALMNPSQSQAQRENALVWLLALSLLLGGSFALEAQSRTKSLLAGTPNGRTVLWRKKVFAALLVSFLAFSILQIRELLLIRAYYSPWTLAAPANSLTFFAHLPQGVNLGLVIALYLLARFAALFAAASVVLLISSLCRKANTAMLASAAVLALPAALSYVGISGFDALSFSKPMSPLSCSFLQYSTFLIVGLLALFGSRWKAGAHV